MRKVCSLFLCILFCISRILHKNPSPRKNPSPQGECKCTPQEEPEHVTILSVYKHERHDGRTDRITVLSDGSFLWAVYVKDKLNETAFANAEELFDHAIQYQNNWDHNKWKKE